jgi:hypothetical protein
MFTLCKTFIIERRLRIEDETQFHKKKERKKFLKD